MTRTRPYEEMVELLGLRPHPEGGFYRETFRSPLLLTLPDGRIRAASTAIHFLLPSGAHSAFHRVAADEAWHHYAGAPLELVTIDAEGTVGRVLLGSNPAVGEQPQHVVPSGVWQAARPVGEGFALVGCTVAPGFDFADFEMPSRTALLGLFPGHRELILEFTSP